MANPRLLLLLSELKAGRNENRCHLPPPFLESKKKDDGTSSIDRLPHRLSEIDKIAYHVPLPKVQPGSAGDGSLQANEIAGKKKAKRARRCY
ncbi:hypothetical protein DY000_02063347 [Brassica cretica]|uniref:Uncharacterized protein n=1 Tax=Brassica cretica TaxID=69181 RepID=A0ABQ7AQ93_BRACR|nr:hypothetical protein DY000_02063347 [Brassica cretica]